MIPLDSGDLGLLCKVLRVSRDNDRSVVSGTGSIPRAMKCYFIKAVEDFVLRVDVIYREVGVDDNVADGDPVAIKVL